MKDHTCLIEGCEGAVASRGWCWAHYARWRRHGDPLGGRHDHDRRAEFERLILVETDEHVLWTCGVNPNGYGQMKIKGQPVYVHYEALLRRRGPSPKGTLACHRPVTCHARSCMNYRHLYWGTPAQNMADRVLDGTDLRGQQIGTSKLRDDEVRIIKNELRSGVPGATIARRFDVTPTMICYIKRGKSWAHID